MFLDEKLVEVANTIDIEDLFQIYDQITKKDKLKLEFNNTLLVMQENGSTDLDQGQTLSNHIIDFYLEQQDTPAIVSSIYQTRSKIVYRNQKERWVGHQKRRH